MNILILVAGTSDRSNSEYLADRFAEGVKTQCPDCAIAKAPRLRDLSVEHFAYKHYDASFFHEPDFVLLQKLITEADGVLIATPVWNFGVPAHLKNLLDRMGSFALDERKTKGTLNGKPFAFIFTGGAPLPAWSGLMSKTTSFVPEAVRYFGGTPVSTHFEGKCTAGAGKFDLVVDRRPDSIEAVKQKGVAFAKIVEVYARDGSLPTAHAYGNALRKVGERLLKKFF